MRRDQIIQEVSTNKEYLSICKRIADNNQLYQDLFQELIIILCEYDSEKLETIYAKGYFKPFVIKLLINQYRSVRGDFYRKYREFQNKSDESFHNPQYQFDIWEEVDGTVRCEEFDELMESSGVVNSKRLNKEYDLDDYEKGKLVEREVQQMDEYDRELFYLYQEFGSSRKIEKETGISSRSIRLRYSQIKEHVKKRL